MQKSRMLVFATAAAMMTGAALPFPTPLSAPAQAQQARVSPPDVASAVIDNARTTIYYSRPYTKDPRTGQPRKIWGGVVPFGQVWRMGANEATMLVTQQPLEVGGATLPAGAYTLFMLPREDGTAQLIVNKQIGQWGSQYDEKQDFGRVALTRETLEKPVDQFTIALSRNDNGGGTMRMSWENAQYSIPFTVKK
jgi:hypothetical protein